jgi:sulfite reductase beta subunit-like hemoprotein
LGRTPILGVQIREGLPWQHLLSYVEAILRVYNRHGRRDNKYKARIKILVKALGIEAFAKEVEEEWQHLKDGPAQLTEAEYARVASAFVRRPITPWPTPIWISARVWPKARRSPAGSRATCSRTRVRVTPAWCCRPNPA